MQKDNYIVVYNIKFDMNISKYNVKYKLDTQETWESATSDMIKFYEYEEDGETKQDNNAWYIPVVESGNYEIQIITASNTLSKSISVTIVTKWAYKEDEEGRKTIVTNGIIDLPIGTYINYNAAVKDVNGEYYTYESPTGTYISENYGIGTADIEQGSGYSIEQTFSCETETNGWRVLGVDEETGEILIISTDDIQTTSNDYFCLRGYTGYQYGIEELNNISAIFGHGKGATGARSINVDDINKITGYNPNNVGVYDPEQKEIGKKFVESTTDTPVTNEYGNKATYSWTASDDEILLEGTNGATGTGSNNYYIYRGFNWFDNVEKSWKSSKHSDYTTYPAKITTLTSNYYTYYPYSLTLDSTTLGTQNGINSDSEEYKTIFFDSTGDYKSYWLASTCINTITEHAVYSIRFVGRYIDVSYIDRLNMINSTGIITEHGCAVQPVVSLKSNIKLKYNDEKVWYDIVE